MVVPVQPELAVQLLAVVLEALHVAVRALREQGTIRVVVIDLLHASALGNYHTVVSLMVLQIEMVGIVIAAHEVAARHLLCHRRDRAVVERMVCVVLPIKLLPESVVGSGNLRQPAAQGIVLVGHAHGIVAAVVRRDTAQGIIAQRPDCPVLRMSGSIGDRQVRRLQHPGVRDVEVVVVQRAAEDDALVRYSAHRGGRRIDGAVEVIPCHVILHQPVGAVGLGAVPPVVAVVPDDGERFGAVAGLLPCAGQPRGAEVLLASAARDRRCHRAVARGYEVVADVVVDC